ncbi:hypothetical protein KUCAC02_034743, partial [Chaenocephalus aceratus]
KLLFRLSSEQTTQRQPGSTAWWTAPPCCVLLFGSLVGNRWSPRVAVMGGGLLSSVGLLLSSFSNSLELLYLTMGVLTGLGFALCYTPAIAMVGCHFGRRRALAYGLAMSGSGIGTFVLAPAVQLLIERYSWRGALLVLSAFVANLCVCGALMQPITAQDDEEDEEEEEEEEEGEKPGLVSDAELALKLRESDDIIKCPETTIAPPPAQRRDRQAAFLMSILGVLDIVGNVTFGWLTDRRCLKAYRLPCYVLAVAMEGLCCLFVPLLRSFQLLVPFAVLYGYFDGAYVALIPVVISDVVGAPYLSSALGVVYFLHAIPYLLSPPVGGWLVDVTGSYSPTFFLSGGALLASAAVISAITGIRRCRRHLNASEDKPRPLCLPDQSERPISPAGAT